MVKRSETENRWRGKRYICLVRQSDDSQGTTSTEAQLRWLREEGARLGMIHVDDVVLNGVTGSIPGKRKDLTDLLERKEKQDDYDVLLVQRCDRLTRGGSGHAMWIEYEFEKAGVTIMYAGEDLPSDDRYGRLIKVAKFEAAAEQARSIAQRSVQGAMNSIAQGRNCVISRTPYGCDRMYLNATKVALFIIRDLGDGRQVKLDIDTKEIIDTYGSVGGGARGHYRKQKDEHVWLIPGERGKVETVRFIFDQHYNHRLGGKRIAGMLNERGILSPEGRGWSQHQVESIYENPIYCGWALGARISQGVYYRHGSGARPEEVDIPSHILANCHSAPKKYRPPEDWVWQEQLLMGGFLERPLAEKALASIKNVLTERWERRQDPTRPTRSTSKHKASEYILTGLLVAKQDGGPLVGVLCGRVGKKVRYYRHPGGSVGYTKGSVYNKMIPAVPLEEAVLDLISEVISNAPDIRARVLEAVTATAAPADAEQELAQLHQRREEITRRRRFIVRNLDKDTLADIKPELDRLTAEGRSLGRRIAQLEQSQRHAAEDPEDIADRVLARLTTLGETTADLSPTTRRELLEALVERVEVDMETKDAAVLLRLPAWALAEDGTMRLAASSASSTIHETHFLAIPLGYADCRYHHVHGSHEPVCYRCRRRRSSA